MNFIENILSNLLRNKNNYRYSKSVQDFAHALYILGGRNVYEFMRMNLPGALPGLTTVNDSLRKAGESIEEGVFDTILFLITRKFLIITLLFARKIRLQ